MNYFASALIQLGAGLTNPLHWQCNSINKGKYMCNGSKSFDQNIPRLLVMEFNFT